MLLNSDRLKKIQSNVLNLQKLKKSLSPMEKEQTDAQFIKTTKVTCSQTENFQLQTQCRDHTLKIDEPLSNGGDNTAMTPVEMLLCAYAGCLEVSWIIYAEMFKAKIAGVSVEINGDLDMRYVLGLEEFPPRYSSIAATFKVVSNDSMHKMEKILERVKKTCCVGGSISSEIRKTFTINLVPE